MLLSDQQKYIISVLKQVKYIRLRQLYSLTVQHPFAVAGIFTHGKSGCSRNICNCVIYGKSVQGAESLFHFKQRNSQS